MNDERVSPNTIVLIHGLWMTPRSWENWISHYERAGYRVLAPAYPGFEVEVEALRTDPRPIAELTVPETVKHLARVVDELHHPPIIIGHSFGGLLTQLLLATGRGAVGVVIDSAPTEGVRVNPPSQIKSLWPFFRNPRTRHRAVAFTPEQFHYAFANTLSAEESGRVYERYAIAAPGDWIWRYGLFANFTPGHQETWVDYGNDDRPPLLFIAGGSDHIMPPSVSRSNAEHYRKSRARTDYVEFAGRSHWTVGEEGWERVADHALRWAVDHAEPATTSPGAG